MLVRDLEPYPDRAGGLIRYWREIGERSGDRLTALGHDRPQVSLFELPGLLDRQIREDPDAARVDDLEQFDSR